MCECHGRVDRELDRTMENRRDEDREPLAGEEPRREGNGDPRLGHAHQFGRAQGYEPTGM